MSDDQVNETTSEEKKLIDALLSESSSKGDHEKEPKACKILIVEDKPLIADRIRGAFVGIHESFDKTLAKQYGLPNIAADDHVQIKCVTNYRDAKKVIEEAAVHKMLDLVVLDLQILETHDSSLNGASDLLGIRLLKDIRSDDPGSLGSKLGYYLPVVLLSANVNTTGERNYGFDAFKKLLRETKTLVLPDDILLKDSDANNHDAGVNTEVLLNTTAKYLIDLSVEEEQLLQDPSGMGMIIAPRSVTRRILRQLKGIARSTDADNPLPDVLLLGDNGVGKSTFARAYDLLRRGPANSRIAFSSQDLGSLDTAGSAASLRLFGGTDFADGSGKPGGAGSLGAFSQATCYKVKGPSGGRREFEGQIFFCPPSTRRTVAADKGLKSDYYPGDDLEPDYEASGTLFLDEVVNVSDEMKGSLLQALGYDRTRRHVFTTGRISRRVPVGPAIIMATRKPIDKIAKKDAGESLATRDYLFRIDQVRVNIPPLSQRLDEVIPYLERAVKKRYPKKTIKVDKRVEYVLMHQLKYRNNFADLERIADRVRPEEDTITFSHVRELFEREVLGGLCKEMRKMFESIEGCLEYLKEIDAGATPMTWTELQRKFELHASELCNLACGVFIHLQTSIWPKQEDDRLIAQYFGAGEKAGGFKAFMGDRCKEIDPNCDPKDVILGRISSYRKTQASLTDANMTLSSVARKSRRRSQSSTQLEQ